MENNEIMNFEEIDMVDDVVVADETTGMSPGVAMAIGAGITFVVGAGVALAVKGIKALKAKREAREREHDFYVGCESDDVAE